MRRGHLILAIVLATSAAGCIDAAEAPGSTSAAIIGGGASTRPEVAYVFSTSGIVCSGVVIGPQHVLTAKSCTFGITPTDFTVGIGDAVGSFTELAVVDVFTTMESPRPLKDGRNELAMVVTDTAIGVPPPVVATDSPRLRWPLTIVGFGDDGTGMVGDKREGVAVVIAVDDNEIELAGAAAACQSDVGGPAYDASGRLVGIQHSTNSRFCSAEVSGVWVNVVRHGDWLRDMTSMGTGPGGDSVAGVDATVPLVDGGPLDVPGTDGGSSGGDGGATGGDGGTTGGGDGGSDAGGGDDGCGCRTPGDAPAPGVWLLALVVVALLTRRRRDA